VVQCDLKHIKHKHVYFFWTVRDEEAVQYFTSTFAVRPSPCTCFIKQPMRCTSVCLCLVACASVTCLCWQMHACPHARLQNDACDALRSLCNMWDAFNGLCNCHDNNSCTILSTYIWYHILMCGMSNSLSGLLHIICMTYRHDSQA